MLTRLLAGLLLDAVLASCGQGEAGSGIKPVGEWAKIGETDNYIYYADYASIKKADETVVMLDLFDYKSAQTEGGGAAPVLSKATEREYDCQNNRVSRSRLVGIPARWEPGTVVRSACTSNQWSSAAQGTATGRRLKAACDT